MRTLTDSPSLCVQVLMAATALRQPDEPRAVADVCWDTLTSVLDNADLRTAVRLTHRPVSMCIAAQLSVRMIPALLFRGC